MDRAYYEQQLRRLGQPEVFGLKLYSTETGDSTNWLSVSPDEAQRIGDVLTGEPLYTESDFINAANRAVDNVVALYSLDEEDQKLLDLVTALAAELLSKSDTSVDDAIRKNWQVEPDEFDEDYLGRERAKDVEALHVAVREAGLRAVRDVPQEGEEQ